MFAVTCKNTLILPLFYILLPICNTYKNLDRIFILLYCEFFLIHASKFLVTIGQQWGTPHETHMCHLVAHMRLVRNSLIVAITGTSVHVATRITLLSESFAWRQSEKRSPLPQCALSGGPCVFVQCGAGNTRCSPTVFKDTGEHGFFWLAHAWDTWHVHFTLNFYILNAFLRSYSVKQLLPYILLFNMPHT